MGLRRNDRPACLEERCSPTTSSGPLGDTRCGAAKRYYTLLPVLWSLEVVRAKAFVSNSLRILLNKSTVSGSGW